MGWMGVECDAGAAIRTALPAARLLRRAREQTATSIVAETMRMLGTDTIAASWRVTPAVMSAAMAAIVPAANLLSHPIEVIEPQSVDLQLMVQPAGQRIPPHRLLFDAESFATYLAFDGGSQA